MKPWLIMTAAILLVGGFALWFSGVMRAPVAQHRDRRDPNLERLERLEAELEANREQLRAIARQSALLGMAAATAVKNERRDPPKEAKTAEEPEERVVETGAREVAYPEAREKAFFSAYFSEIDAAMKSQPRDVALSMQVRDVVLASIGTTRQAELVDVNCTVQICRLEARYQHETRAARDRFFGEMRHKLAPVLDQATIHMPTDDKRMVAYFSKQGARLPRPTTSFDAFMRGDEG